MRKIKNTFRVCVGVVSIPIFHSARRKRDVKWKHKAATTMRELEASFVCVRGKNSAS